MMPTDWITTLGFVSATAAASVGAAAALRRMGGAPAAQAERAAALAVVIVCGGLFVYRAIAVHADWVPLAYHADGLALLGALLGLTVVYLQWTRRLPGVGLFGLPVLAVLMLWGVCASWWTLRPFAMDSVWQQVHLFGVYIGALGVTLAAAAGAMWLYVDRQLRKRDHPADRLRRLGRLGDLESIEQVLSRSVMVGFVALSMAAAAGLVVITGGPTELGPTWWATPKIMLATLVWLLYAGMVHVRLAPVLRGRWVALMAIVGFVLMVIVLAMTVGGGGV